MLAPGEWDQFTDELRRRHWEKLADPEPKYHEELIREFYANAYPLMRSSSRRVSWVRGTQIPYDRQAIDDFLGTGYVLADDDLDSLTRIRNADGFTEDLMLSTLCLPGRSFAQGRTGQNTKLLRKDLKSIARIWQNFLFSNVLPITHISDVNIPRAELMCAILQGYDIDISRIISNELHSAILAESSVGYHKPLVFPGLITGLLRAQHVNIPSQPLKPIRPPLTITYINTHCVNPEEGVAGPAPQRPERPSRDVPSEMGTVTRMLRSIHLGQCALNESLYHLSQRQLHGGPAYQWPSPADFATIVQWPEDTPQSFGGGPAAEAEPPIEAEAEPPIEAEAEPPMED